MIEHDEKCPYCSSTDTYEAECDDTDCAFCGNLFFYCKECGYTNHDCAYELN